MRQPLVLVLALTAGACAASRAIPQPFPRPETSPISASERSWSEAVVSTALSLRGAPYRDGGGDPAGFDCSGFVAYVFAQQGLFVPRTVADQFAVGVSVDPQTVTSGDLVFFSTVAAGPSHVGIAISSDEFVHAPSSAGVVRVEALSAPYWASRVVGARRVR
jgi:cell wall-associated NlpC family hydrolase